MTLDDVTIELMESNQRLKSIDKHTIDTNEYLLLTIDTFTEKFSELIEFFKGNSLLEIEKEREENEYKKDLLAAIEGIELTQSQRDVQIAEGFLDSLARLGVLLGGLTIAAAAISGAFVSFLKNVRATIKGIGALAKALSPAGITKAVTKVFDTIGDFLKFRLTAAGGAFGSAISGIVGFFKTVGTFFKDSIFKIPGVKGVVETITRAVAAVKNVVASSAKLGETVSKIGGIFRSFRNVFTLVFKFVSRIFAPLYTLYETIVGIWKGYQDGGFIGAIKGGITGFFKGFIGDFLNLIKDAGAWIAGKLGFTEAANILSEFDFNVLFRNMIDSVFSAGESIINFYKEALGFSSEDGETKTFGEQVKATAIGLLTLPYTLTKKVIGEIAGLLGFDNIKESIEDFSPIEFFRTIIDTVFETLSSIGTWIGDKFDFSNLKDKLSSLAPSGDVAENFIKEALRAILPKPDESAGFFSVSNIVSSAIPDSVYEYAGIDPDTGALIEAPKVEEPIIEAPAQKKAEILGGEAQASEIEKQMRVMEMSSAAPIVNAPTTTSNNVSNNTTNNIVNRPPSPVRQPNSPSDTIWSGASVAQ